MGFLSNVIALFSLGQNCPRKITMTTKKITDTLSASQSTVGRQLTNLRSMLEMVNTQPTVSFETPIIHQFPMKLPTDLVSVIIPAKYVI